MLRCLLWALAAAVQRKALLIADNLCLRHQLLILQRRKPRPRPEDVDRRFWILAYRWFAGWQTSLLVIKPETVLRWHRPGWRTYWRRRSRRTGRAGRRPIAPELRTLIRRMTPPAHWEQARLIEVLKLERSSRYLCSDAFITFISKPHDHVPDPILAPYNGLERLDAACRRTNRHHSSKGH